MTKTAPGINCFTLTAVHVALIALLSFKWEEAPFDGGIVVDKRKPFEDGKLIDTVATAMGIQQVEDDNGKKFWPVGTRARALEMYYELVHALAVVCSAQSFVPGIYQRDEIGGKWSLLGQRATA